MSRLLIDVMFHNDTGGPLSGGKLFFYETGTTTLANTYEDEAETVAHANPIVLDANGRCGDIWFTGVRKLVVKDSNGVTIPNGTFDPIYSSNSSSGDAGSNVWVFWNGASTYSEGDLVVGTDDCWYRSIGNSNLNNNPVSTSGYWVSHSPIFIWDTVTTFSGCHFVYYSGLVYRSLANSNLNNNPITSTANWEPLGYQFRHNDEGTIVNAATVELDLLQYNRFTVTVDTGASITINFVNQPALADNYFFDITLIRGVKGNITWDTKSSWPYQTEPEWTQSASLIDIIKGVKVPGDDTFYLTPHTMSAAIK